MTDTRKPIRRELFIGLIAPLGVNKSIVQAELRRVFRKAGYDLHIVKISDFLARNETWLSKTPNLTRSPLSRRKDLMDAGDSLRRLWSSSDGSHDRGDAGTYAAITEILAAREAAGGSIPEDKGEKLRYLNNHAYLIDSLKHPDEVDRFRQIYGPAFVSIAIYAPKKSRKEALEAELEASEDDALVDQLIQRDEHSVVLGQNVSDAFYNADFFVDGTREPSDIQSALLRLIRLLFGDIYLTPDPDEYGMFLARSAQVRSASLARQIGASILRNDGTVASLGTNEVAKPITGGQYWPADDKSNGRDKDYKMPGLDKPRDTSDWWREEMISDLLSRLKKVHAFNSELNELNVEDLMDNLAYCQDAPLKSAKVKQNIDYVRAVHAEAAAILDAGRHGASLLGASIYATTFPCHECGRHIVASGLHEVVYLEPYPKSAIPVLFTDSITIDPSRRELEKIRRDPRKVIFRAFVGVSPTRYLDFFSLGSRVRKDRFGKPTPFELKEAVPSLPYYAPTPERVATAELFAITRFSSFVESHQRGSAAT